MNNFKMKRNIWIFAGLCFLLSTILFLSNDKTIGLRSVFMMIACIASFINAYNTHKKEG